jgi:hypothetical protein
MYFFFWFFCRSFFESHPVLDQTQGVLVPCFPDFMENSYIIVGTNFPQEIVCIRTNWMWFYLPTPTHNSKLIF